MRTTACLLAAATTVALVSPAPANAGVQYVYDSSGRLIRAVYSNGITIIYRYDAAGNRTQIVTSNAPNAAPSAANDTASVNPSASLDIMVRANDTDPEENTLTVTSVGAPTGGGSVSIQGGGTYVRYTAPTSGGTKTLTYTIADGAGGTDTATVSVTVSSTNIAPVAVSDGASAVVDTSQSIFVLNNDTDANDHSLTVTSVTAPSDGTVSIGAGGGYVIYSAPSIPGNYGFNYTVSDGNGGTDTAFVSVSITAGETGCVPTPGQNCEIEP